MSSRDERLEKAYRLLKEVADETAPYTRRLMETIWGDACREWLTGDSTHFCNCPNSIPKAATDGKVFCTACGWSIRE